MRNCINLDFDVEFDLWRLSRTDAGGAKTFWYFPDMQDAINFRGWLVKMEKMKNDQNDEELDSEIP